MTSVPVSVTIQPVRLRGREAAWLRTVAPAATPDGYDAQFDALEAALAGHGYRPADAVRSRLTAATRDGRNSGSVVRLRRQAVPFRCATSSYIDPSRFPGGDGAMLETLVVRGAGDDKVAREHEPSPPPWRVVATGDLAFFSGITSFEAGVDAQLADMADRVHAAVGLAEGLVGRPFRPFAAAAFVQRELDLGYLGDLGDRLGLADVVLTVARCDGFSYPSKLVEVEIDAAAMP